MKRMYIRFPGHRNIFEVTKIEIYNGIWTAWLKAGKLLPLEECTNKFRKKAMEFAEGELIDWYIGNADSRGASLVKLTQFLETYECNELGDNWMVNLHD